MSSNALVKKVFDELKKMDDMGFKTWITSVRELASRYDISTNSELEFDAFKKVCTDAVEQKFIAEWQNDVKNESKYPILRTYRKFKTRYELEPYLYLVKNPKYRIAISKLRSSSHMLEIERGRHTRPVTPLENRLCPTCKVVESEIHFLLDCPSYEPFREELFKKIDSVDLYFKQLLPINKFLYLTSTSNEQILKWFGKFIYLSLNKRTNIAK